MPTEVTLSLPERLVEDARRFGEATHRDGEEVLADLKSQSAMWINRNLSYEMHFVLVNIGGTR